MNINIPKGGKISTAFKYDPSRFEEYTNSGKSVDFYDNEGDLVARLSSWRNLPKVVKNTCIKHSVEYVWFPTWLAGSKKDALGKPYMEVYKRPYNLCRNGALPISEKPATLNI